ncbi:thyrotropin-releasing hormone receptor [Elysia marginata]|uniref:Thyrotropin-releasing hormone receptor n=1 Tax=Elysia marginata TaxID=1093978 RepID=A0AAV4FRA7_9GAST|nr:thyrotropin-releasing hormone receptor [Elysia marginata]
MTDISINESTTTTTISSFDFGTFNKDDLFAQLGRTQSKDIQELNEVSQDISKYYLIVLAAIGVPSNALTVATILSMHALSPATFFVVLLAIFDGCALVVKLIGNQLAQHEMTGHNWFCKFFNPLSIFFSTTANWILVLICLERFISVCYPLKKVYLFTKRRSFIIAAILIGSLFTFILTTLGVMQTFKKNKCTTEERFESFFANVWPYLSVALHLFVPFVLIAVLTAFIIYGLQRSRKHRMSLLRKNEETNEEMKVLKDGAGAPRKSRSSSTPVAPPALHNQKMLNDTARIERTITLMLIAAAVIFLVLSLPMSMYYLMLRFHESREKSIEAARWRVYHQVAYVFVDSSHAVNFFLYFFTAKRFRDQLIRIVTGRASCWGRRISTRGREAGSSSTHSDNRRVSKTATSHFTASTCLHSSGSRGSSTVYYPQGSE